MSTTGPPLDLEKMASDGERLASHKFNANMETLNSSTAGLWNGFLTKNVAGSTSPITLTEEEQLNGFIKLTGVRTANLILKVDKDVGFSRGLVIWNATTGAFTVTVVTTAGGSTGIAVTQGKTRFLYHDGTNVLDAVTESGATVGSVINTGTTTIGADSDSDGDGVIDLQTRGTTRLRVLNGGDVYLFNKLGINTPAPAVPLEFTVHYAADVTASEPLIRFKTPTGTDPAGVVHTPFEIYQRSTTFGADRTDSVGIGFSGVGGEQGPGNFGFLFEDSFGSPYQAELHIIYAAKSDGSQHRPWTWSIDTETGIATRVTTSALEIGFTAGDFGDLDANAFSIATTGVNATIQDGSFSVNSDSVIFSTSANVGNSAKYIHVFPFPSDSEKSWLVFGDTGSGQSIVSSGGKLRFYMNGSTLDDGAIKLGTIEFTGGAVQNAAYPGGLDVVKVGVGLASLAEVSPISLFGTLDYMILSDLSNTIINAPTSGDIAFRVHNSTKLIVNGSGANLSSGLTYKINGTQVVGAQGAAIADATDNPSAITQLNLALAAMRTHGLIAT